MTQTSLPPNWTYIGGSFYLVRTQAGFKRAIKHFRRDSEKMECRGYPKVYPAIVSFSYGYDGSIYLVANCIRADFMRDAIIANDVPNNTTNKQNKREVMNVLIVTNHGNIKIALDEEKAPETVKNFLAYVDEGFYNSTLFHRVIDGFMIQGGGFQLSEAGIVHKVSQEKRDPVANEAKNMLRNDAYTIAMARTSAPHSATNQFFINVKNNDFLNYPGQDGWGYAVFGNVIEGKDVVDKIKAVKTTRVGMHADVPTEAVIIEKIERISVE